MSTEFPGEVARSAKKLGARRTKPTSKPITKAPPRARSKLVVKRKDDKPRPEFGQLIADLKSGVSRLGQLAGQLAASRQRDGVPQVPDARRVSPEVTKLIERELRTITKLVPGESREIIKEFRQLAERAAKMHVPQSHAALMEGAKRLQPAETLRPTSPAVQALMKATNAIRSGRLPFLPKETRKEAQKLLNEIFGKPKAMQIAKSTRIPQMIEQQRLIPAAVSGMVKSSAPDDSRESPLLGFLKQSLAAPLAALKEAYKAPSPPPVPDAQGRVPVGAQDLPRLSRALPSFAATGGARGGAFLSHAGEDLTMITQNDSPLFTSAEAAAELSEGLTPMPQAKSSRSPISPPSDGSGASAGRGGGSVIQGATESQSKGPAKVEDTLSIPELGNAVAKFTGFMTDNGALT